MERKVRCKSLALTALAEKVGAFGEASSQIRDLADLVACELSAEHLAFFDIAKKESKGIITQRTRRSLGLAVQCGKAKLVFCPPPGRRLAFKLTSKHEHSKQAP